MARLGLKALRATRVGDAVSQWSALKEFVRRPPLLLGFAPVGAFVSGAAFGWLAWRPDGAVALVAALPLIWAIQPTRAAAGLLWLAYFLVGARDVAPVVARFFPDEPWALGLVLWGLHAALLAAPWMALWPSGDTLARAVALRTASAIVVLTVPPLGCLGWLSPLLAAGVLYPGWGWTGVVCTVTLLSASGVMGHAVRNGRMNTMRRWMVVTTGFLAIAVVTNIGYRPPEPPPDWLAIDTQLGPFPTDQHAGFDRQQQLIGIAEAAIANGAKVIVLPEEVAGTWRTAVAYWWQPLGELAARHGSTVLVGADLPVSPGLVEEAAPRFTNSLVLLGASEGIVNARQPIPIGLWRPWSKTTAVADLAASGVIVLRGLRVAVSICYEDLLAWPLLLSFARNPSPQVMISSANNWFYDGADALWIQRHSVELWARLFGVPLLRAVNLPFQLHHDGLRVGNPERSR